MKPAYSKLKRTHQLFVDAFVRLGVGSDAYSTVFPDAKRPDVGAAKLMAKPGLKEAIEERTQAAIARAGVRQVRVLEELAAIAFADIAELFNDQGSLQNFADMTPRARATIQAIDCEELLVGVGEDRKPYGIVRKLKMHSKVDALKQLGQHLKLFTERHEHSGPNGEPIPVKDVSELSELDLARRIAFVLARGLRASAATPDPAIPPVDSTAHS